MGKNWPKIWKKIVGNRGKLGDNLMYTDEKHRKLIENHEKCLINGVKNNVENPRKLRIIGREEEGKINQKYEKYCIDF